MALRSRGGAQPRCTSSEAAGFSARFPHSSSSWSPTPLMPLRSVQTRRYALPHLRIVVVQKRWNEKTNCVGIIRSVGEQLTHPTRLHMACFLVRTYIECVAGHGCDGEHPLEFLRILEEDHTTSLGIPTVCFLSCKLKPRAMIFSNACHIDSHHLLSSTPAMGSGSGGSKTHQGPQ